MSIIVGRWIALLIYAPHLYVYRRWGWSGIFIGWTAFIAFGALSEYLSGGDTSRGEIQVMIGSAVLMAFLFLRVGTRTAHGRSGTSDSLGVAQLGGSGDVGVPQPLKYASGDGATRSLVCPECGRESRSDARICRGCHFEFVNPPRPPTVASATPVPDATWPTQKSDDRGGGLRRPSYSGEWRVLSVTDDSPFDTGDDVEILVLGGTLRVATLDGPPGSPQIEYPLDEVTAQGNTSEVTLAAGSGTTLVLDWWDGQDGGRLCASIRKGSRRTSPPVFAGSG